MKILLEIGEIQDTDKVCHAYLPHYDKRFQERRLDPVSILEIGVMDGASLRTWKDYFLSGLVYGIDIIDKNHLEEDRIQCFTGDQAKEKFLRKVLAEVGDLDFVVDDGGHYGTQHVASFMVLWPAIKPGGWYCIEDCFSIFNKCWTQPEDYTMLHLLQENWEPIMLGQSDACEVSIISDGINDGLIFIRKRPDPEGFKCLASR